MSQLFQFYKDKNDLLQNRNGIRNIGNTCYINSILQVLRYNVDLYNYFLKLKFKPLLIKNIYSFLTVSWYNFLKNIWEKENKT